jgi:hypothetical protein
MRTQYTLQENNHRTAGRSVHSLATLGVPVVVLLVALTAVLTGLPKLCFLLVVVVVVAVAFHRAAVSYYTLPLCAHGEQLGKEWTMGTT